jgi:hypothetical protein
VTLDLQGTYRRCTPPMTWATAAMLSARFPTVTPAGRVPGAGCPQGRDLQLVDGGYAEGSGLGTLADLSAEVMQLVRARNATAGSTPVLPLVLYLEDEPRTEIVAEPGRLTPELFVPLAGRDAAADQVSTGAWLQRLSDDVADPCPPGPAGNACTAAVVAAHGVLRDRVVVAAPLTRPAVEAPLGWTLSPDSRRQLALDLEDQVADCSAAPSPGGYPCLTDLLSFLDGGDV